MTFPFSVPPSEQQHLSSRISHPLSGDPVSPAYIHIVQHLIEKCLLFELDREECVAALETHANIKPAITRTVWDELEKANDEFFAAYLQRLSIARSSSQNHNHNSNNSCESLDRALIEATNAMCQQSLRDS